MVLMINVGDNDTPGVPHVPDGGLRHGVRWSHVGHGHRLASLQGILVLFILLSPKFPMSSP